MVPSILLAHGRCSATVIYQHYYLNINVLKVEIVSRYFLCAEPQGTMLGIWQILCRCSLNKC